MCGGESTSAACSSSSSKPNAHGNITPTGTVSFAIAATTTDLTPSGLQTPTIQPALNAPAVPYSTPGINTSMLSHHNSSLAGLEATNASPLSRHLTAIYAHDCSRGHNVSNVLHSTVLNNVIDANQTPLDVSQQQRIPSHSVPHSAYPVHPAEAFAFRRNADYNNIHTNTHTVTSAIPVWTQSVPYNRAQALSRQNPFMYSDTHVYGSTATQSQYVNMCAPSASSACCGYQSNFSMPSPITASFIQPNAVTSNIHGSVGGVICGNTSAPHIYTATADITLSSSQIAARQVITKELPCFSGRPEEWPMFITNYTQSTERCGFTDQENLLRLQKCLKGPALEAVRGKLMMPSTVSCAIDTLKMLFGRPDVIYESMQRKLRQEPVVKPDKLESLIQFALSVQNYCATISAVGFMEYLNDPVLLADLVSKLPSDLKLDWGRHQMSLARVDMGAFDKWLFGLATWASYVTTIGLSSITRSSETKNLHKQPKHRILVQDVIDQKTSSSTQHPCPKCKQGHHLANCSEFCSSTNNERWKFVRDNRLCIRCFRKHNLRRCNSRKQCGIDGCKLPHNLLLHTTTQHQTNQVRSGLSEGSKTVGIVQNPTVLFHSKDQKRALFRYVPVTLYGVGKSLNTYALLDEGSACTLMESSIASELGLNGPSMELCLKWTGDITHSEANSKMVNLDISSRDINAQRFNLRNVRTVSSLDLPVQSLDISVLQDHHHLRQLPIQPYKDAQARILIGLDNAKIGMPLEAREAEGHELIATRCRIGWAVYGRDGDSNSPLHSVLHICPCSSGENMDEMLKFYFSLDSVGIQATSLTLQSKENERALRIMDMTSKYLPIEKRWETGLLWKYETVNLPNSFPMAKRTLECLESKMKRDPHLNKYLLETIRNYEEKGYIRKLKKEEISSGGKSWYLPIFTVINPNKNKRRLVWDAAAKVNDISLNSFLMKGPDMLASLVGVLIRFRERAVALCGDIREMFHQVYVRKEDQIAQQFLWRDGDSTREPDVFAMLVMTFDASCSPSLANYIKNKNATRWKKEHPEAVNAIIKNTYVDDWLQSVDTEKEMSELAVAVRFIHSEGGFEMRNWTSNSRSVLATLTGSTVQHDIRIEEFNVVQEKVLGLWWRPCRDEFTFIHKFDKAVFDETTFPTKRQILRIVMTIFDPLGLLGFYVIHAKIILQNIWRSGAGWDEPVTDDVREEWWNWIRRIPLISAIRIPRCYGLVSTRNDIQLHVFVDASINAYAAVAYLRGEKEGETRCSLVASKTRVAPLKPVSVPRLELMAAILGLRLAKLIGKERSIPISHRIFWTDSKNVLYWIRSDARKFHQFVSLRIGEILEGSEINEWRWVPTSLNVADEGTKWSKSSELDSHSRWFNSPQFLCSPESEWPVTNLSSRADLEPEEVYHMEMKTKSVSKLTAISPDPNRFSRWERLCGAQRFVLKFLRVLVKSLNVSDSTKNLLAVQPTDGAELVLIRICQEEAFPEELECLRSENNRPIFTIESFITITTKPSQRNGTNFRGASRILVNEIEKISCGELERKYPAIEWSFIPPASPHMGGAWERMIRSVKSILMDILYETGLREDVLRATLADIENILNSRPLTYVPLDSPESEALTPNHFLIGSSSGIRERGSENDSGLTLRRNFNLSNQLANQFWKHWVREYLPCLTRRSKWFQPPLNPIALQDVVIIFDENSSRNTWKKGIVVDMQYARNGEARSAVVKTVHGLVTRPIVKLAKLDVRGVNITQ